MVDIEKIKEQIETLKGLSAEEYCAEAVAKIYADFEHSRVEEIAKLETALSVFESYQVVDNAEEITAEIEDIEIAKMEE